jgi:hypothetical protein
LARTGASSREQAAIRQNPARSVGALVKRCEYSIWLSALEQPEIERQGDDSTPAEAMPKSSPSAPYKVRGSVADLHEIGWG